MYTYRIVTGDWSDDGHGKSDQFTFNVNYNIDQIRKAYKKAQKKLKIAFDCNEKGKYKLCEAYENDSLSKETINHLRQSGVNFDNIQFGTMVDEDGSQLMEPSEMAFLFLEVVKTEIPDLSYELVQEPESINGYWCKDLNIGIGYGCYN